MRGGRLTVTPQTAHEGGMEGGSMQELKERVALVTGGGRGLGEAISRVLAGAGANVIVADVRADLARGVVDSIAGGESQAAALELDVTDAGQAQAAVDRIVGERGRLDILVNNAGVDATLPVDELSVEQ